MTRHTRAALEIREEPGLLLFAIRGEIDHHGARALREELDLAILRARPYLVTLDLSGVTFMDSSGLGLIVGRLSTVTDLGGRLRLVGISRQIQRILLLAGAERLSGLEIEPLQGTGSKKSEGAPALGSLSE
jgi:stage II sporulation protein AA (anti-sigma F factor antagonist)